MSCTITIRATYKLNSNKRQYMFSKKNEKQNNKNICLKSTFNKLQSNCKNATAVW